MDGVMLKARGKINLSLDITGIMDNGYHSVAMIMQSVELCDRVTVKRTDGGINITCDDPQIPVDEGNLAYKATQLMIKEFSVEGGFDISIQKNIPVGGGMAGGSTDAAAVLKAINLICGLGLTVNELMKVGVSLGADVPFCIYEKPAFCEGIGEKITPIKGIDNCDIVLVNPKIFISTKEIYQLADKKGGFSQINNKKIIESFEKNDIISSVGYMKNILQPITAELHNEINEIVDWLYSKGAVAAMMSGSGSTCFGIFESGKIKNHKLQYRDYFIKVTKPYNG